MAERVAGAATVRRGVSVAIVGGTGDQGRGLATRWAAQGAHVVIGSRDDARATDVARLIPGDVVGLSNARAVARCQWVVVAVPWSAHETTLVQLRDSLVGRIVIDCVNPLGFDDRGPYSLHVAEGSAVEAAAALLPGSTVIGAFHHLSSVLLLDPTLARIDSDVMVVGDDRPATDSVIGLAELIPGVRGVYAGRQRNARQVEALTANLIAVNRRYRTHSGIRLTGLGAPAAP